MPILRQSHRACCLGRPVAEWHSIGKEIPSWTPFTTRGPLETPIRARDVRVLGRTTAAWETTARFPE